MKLASVVVPSVVAGALVLTLGACGSKAASSSGDAGANSNQSATTETKKAEPASDSKVAVTIDGMSQTTDYSGKPCIVIDYTFTNVSAEDAQAFSTSTRRDVYQGGVELETACVSGVDSSANLNKVKAGSSIAVHDAYVLKDSSDVEVNVYPLISFDDKKPLAQQTFSLS